MHPKLTRRVAGVGALALAACGQPQADYCAMGTRTSLIFIDVTTPYDDTDRNEIRRIFARIVESLGVGDRLTLRTIGAKYAESREEFDKCKPGCPPGQSGLDDYLGTRCARTQAQEAHDAFMSLLIARVSPLIQNEVELEHSDVVATLGRWTTSYAAARRYDEIIVYSDLLENSRDRPWAWFRDQDADDLLSLVAESGLSPAADGATVRVFGFGRLHGPGRPPLPTELDNRLRDFWTRYFMAAGAAEVLFGAAPQVP